MGPLNLWWGTLPCQLAQAIELVCPYIFLMTVFKLKDQIPFGLCLRSPVSVWDLISFFCFCLALAAGPKPTCLGPILTGAPNPRFNERTRWSWNATAAKVVEDFPSLEYRYSIRKYFNHTWFTVKKRPSANVTLSKLYFICLPWQSFFIK